MHYYAVLEILSATIGACSFDTWYRLVSLLIEATLAVLRYEVHSYVVSTQGDTDKS